MNIFLLKYFLKLLIIPWKCFDSCVFINYSRLIYKVSTMSRSFLMDSIINSPHCGHTSPPLSSPASLPSSPGSPFPYPAFGGYLFSFGLQHPGFPKPMMYPPYPLYGLDAPDTKLVRPVPLPSLRKPSTPPHRQRPSPKPHRPVDIVIKPQTSPTHSLTGEYSYLLYTDIIILSFWNQFINLSTVY